MALTSVNAFNVIIYFCARTELIGMDMNLHYPSAISFRLWDCSEYHKLFFMHCNDIIRNNYGNPSWLVQYKHP